jgi:hypothetical protein
MSVGMIKNVGTESEEYLTKLGVKSVSIMSEATIGSILVIKFLDDQIEDEHIKLDPYEAQEFFSPFSYLNKFLKKSKVVGRRIIAEERKKKLEEIQTKNPAR